VLTVRAIWTTMAGAFATHVTWTFRITTWAIAWRRTILSPMSVPLFAITARAVVVTTFVTGMMAPSLAILGWQTHFVAIATARTVKVVSVRWAIETAIG
jgi:hypothetical protein